MDEGREDVSAVSREVLENEVARLQVRAGQAESYRALFDAIDDGLCIIEFIDGPHGPYGDYVHVEANPGYERHTGIRDIVGKTLRQIEPDQADGWAELYGNVLRTGEPIRFERAFVAIGRYIEVSAARVEPASRRQVSVLFRDISERRRAEALARENAERVQLALSAGAIAGTWFWDLRTNHFSADEAFVKTMGIDPGMGREGLKVEQIVRCIHPDDRAGVEAAVRDGIERGGAYAHRYRVWRGDSRYHWMEANGRVEHEDGVPTKFSGVLLDIEERRSIEDERDRAAEALRALNDSLEQRVAERTAELMAAEEQLRHSQKMEAVGQLTGGVAHDFNNLLTIIRSSADLLRRQELAPERRKRYVDAISDTADRAAKLTGQLLAFARRQALSAEVFDAVTRLGIIADMLQSVVGSRVELAVDAAAGTFLVEADASQFETAIVNMAVNARDAMDGEGRIRIAVAAVDSVPSLRGHAALHGAFVAVTVADTGSGMSPDQLERIFEPFYTTKEVGKGTGLGLSQVYGFAKQSGGGVDVASEPGRGTTFTLYLPQAAGEPERDPVAGGQAPAHSDGRILVVEDNEQVGEFASQLLNDLGYATRYAGNVRAAMAILEEDDAFDIVFSDVVMPGESGVDFGRRVRERWPDMTVVLTSGYSHVLADDARHGFDLLHKPYSVEELSRVLRQARRRG